MSDHQFRDLVRKMRQAQKEYFRTRNSGWLRLSKDLERKVDDALGGEPEASGDLFGGR